MTRMGLTVAVTLGMGSLAGAQQQALRREPTGTVTGHVFCTDTQRPARLAKVNLVPVPAPAAKNEALDKSGDNDFEGGLKTAGESVETGLDGSFTIRDVKPGEYYLVVDKEGYMLPLAAFTAKELTGPSDEVKERMAKSLRSILVGADQTVQQEVSIERGASVSGTVTYDDGSPAGEIDIEILQMSAEGKWEAGIQKRYRSTNGFVRTDDFGHYRVTGLPPGDYVVESDLSSHEYQTTTSPMPGSTSGAMMTMKLQTMKFELPLFSGNVWRKPKAQAFSLGNGEQRSGMDLQFPLSKLHKVSGQVLAKDGHALNDGKLALLNADDQSKVTGAQIDRADSEFHLEFVPEGEFSLRVSEARDVTTVQAPNPPGMTPKFHDETRTVKTYGDAEQALLVQGDVSDVALTVPEPGKQ